MFELLSEQDKKEFMKEYALIQGSGGSLEDLFNKVVDFYHKSLDRHSKSVYTEDYGMIHYNSCVTCCEDFEVEQGEGDNLCRECFNLAEHEHQVQVDNEKDLTSYIERTRGI